MTEIFRAPVMRPSPILLLPLLLSLATPAMALDCGKMIETHGFKAEAQAECRFGQYENDGLAQARSCAGRQDPSVNVAEIQRGQAVFRTTARRMGRAGACADVFRTFGGIFYHLR